MATLEVSDWEEGGETNGAIVSPSGNAIEVTVTPATTSGEEYTTATEAERKVQDLAAYLFDADGKLEKAYTGLLSEAWTPAATGDGQKITLNNILTKENKTFYIVANAAANNTVLLENLEEGITTANFEALMATAATGNLDCPLLMFKKVEISGEAWTDDVIQISAVLERAAARIDLRLNAENGFTPTTVKLVGANNQSFVIASTAATATIPLTLTATTKATEAKDGYLNYPQLFYTYSIGNTEGMYLLLEGTQKSGANTAQAIYKKPLNEMNLNKISHNTCYTITIEDVSGVPLVTEGGIGGGVVED
ncbi:fimbrial protein [Bacteroides rodentium]